MVSLSHCGLCDQQVHVKTFWTEAQKQASTAASIHLQRPAAAASTEEFGVETSHQPVDGSGFTASRDDASSLPVFALIQAVNQLFPLPNTWPSKQLPHDENGSSREGPGCCATDELARERVLLNLAARGFVASCVVAAVSAAPSSDEAQLLFQQLIRRAELQTYLDMQIDKEVMKKTWISMSTTGDG